MEGVQVMAYFAFALICAMSSFVAIIVNLLLLGDPNIFGALLSGIITFIVGSACVAYVQHTEKDE